MAPQAHAHVERRLNDNGGLRATQLRLKVLANQHRVATGMQLSSAELRDYALDALDPAKGRAPTVLADTHARQVVEFGRRQNH